MGLTLIFGTLGVVNFAHGALFMIGGFCAVSVQMLLKLSTQVKDESIPGLEMMVDVPYLQVWWGDLGLQIISFAVPLSIVLAIPLMLALGVLMERGLIRHFYHRTHADQIVVTFGLAIVLQELIMYTPIVSPNYRIGMDFLVLSCVVVVVGGMGSLPGAVASGFLLGILQSFASMNEIKQLIPGIDQVIVYLVAVVILLTRPRGLLGRKGVMED